MARPDGPHSGNPAVRASVARGDLQHVAWAAEREGGGRAFGFTGGHVHWNWGHDDFRKTVLNAIVWAAHGEVPAEGVSTATPQRGELEANQDYPKPQPRDDVSQGERPSHAGPKSLGTSTPIGLTTKLVAQSDSVSVHDPAVAVDNLDVHPELEATLFAAEPLLLSPSNIDVDHRGRVWVCEVINYRAHRNRRPEGDRILILEDTDGDGQADSQKVFYQGEGRHFAARHLCARRTGDCLGR